MASSIEDLRAVMESTLTKYFENSTLAAQTKDVSLISAVLTPDCLRYLKPAAYAESYPSIKAVETNVEYEARMALEFAVLEESTASILEIVIDPVKRKGSAHVEHTAKVIGRDPVVLEICWYVDFTEDGKNISRMVKFIDTAAGSKVMESILKQGSEESQGAS
ncbi:hypothetical protein F5Y11DRAFT_182223 [Daldinia sp. FL1419]|nr:hypothetical protein F5Y11DRAFT_182223 [Daldinia sp. FL1419]